MSDSGLIPLGRATAARISSWLPNPFRELRDELEERHAVECPGLASGRSDNLAIIERHAAGLGNNLPGTGIHAHHAPLGIDDYYPEGQAIERICHRLAVGGFGRIDCRVSGPARFDAGIRTERGIDLIFLHTLDTHGEGALPLARAGFLPPQTDTAIAVRSN